MLLYCTNATTEALKSALPQHQLIMPITLVRYSFYCMKVEIKNPIFFCFLIKIYVDDNIQHFSTHSNFMWLTLAALI